MKITLSVLSALLLTFLSGFVPAQDEKYPFSKWDDATLKKANTVEEADYMTAGEKEVIRLCNLARLQPKLFGDTYLQKYIDDNELKRSSYITSLFSDLKKAKPLPVFMPQKDLFLSAEEHAIVSGKKGTLGHQNFTKRIKKYAPRYASAGENCDYGNDQALDIVMSLLIDEGIADKGHRKNILDPAYNSCGVAIREHKKYEFNAVMNFGVLE